MNRETIDRIRNGDLDAYERIVRRYQAMLLGYAAHRLADWNAAEEVVQLTFIRAYEKLDEFRPDGDFGVWLCVICKHFILTELERQRREAGNLGKYGNTLRTRLGGVLAGGDDTAQQQDVLSILRVCLREFKTEAASLIDLRYGQQKSCREIADLTQRSLTWVTSTLSRSRQALRLCMEQRLGQEHAL